MSETTNEVLVSAKKHNTLKTVLCTLILIHFTGMLLLSITSLSNNPTTALFFTPSFIAYCNIVLTAISFSLIYRNLFYDYNITEETIELHTNTDEDNIALSHLRDELKTKFNIYPIICVSYIVITSIISLLFF